MHVVGVSLLYSPNGELCLSWFNRGCFLVFFLFSLFLSGFFSLDSRVLEMVVRLESDFLVLAALPETVP